MLINYIHLKVPSVINTLYNILYYIIIIPRSIMQNVDREKQPARVGILL